MNDALFLLSLTALALAGYRRSYRGPMAGPMKRPIMPQACRIRPALTPIDDLQPGDAVEDNFGYWTVCTPDDHLVRLAGRVLATMFADGLTASGPEGIEPFGAGHDQPAWLLEQGLWVEVNEAA